MNRSEFSAYYVERDVNGVVQGRIKTLSDANLPPGDVLIRAEWSSLNYKDALAATGNPGVARRLPHVPGIDVAGTVTEIANQEGTSDLQVGDEVLVTGYGLGADRWGGWAEYVRVPRGWIIKRPPALSLRETMVLGTAGFTAAQCVQSLQHHGIQPESGDVVVTGATGGVGCIAVKLLAKLGYRVHAVTGKPGMEQRLRAWGALAVLGREEVLDASDKPLLPGRWAGAVDTVGGATLTTLIRQTKDHGCVSACGLVGGTNLGLTVFPFILRGVTLAGITSSGCLPGPRQEVWRKLAGPWKLDGLEELTTEVRLQEVGDLVPKILAGGITGRTVVRIV